MFAAGALHVFGERQLLASKNPARTQRPQHAEQQPVDMLRGHAGDDARIAQFMAPQLLEGFYLIGHLPQAFVDPLGLAAGA